MLTLMQGFCICLGARWVSHLVSSFGLFTIYWSCSEVQSSVCLPAVRQRSQVCWAPPGECAWDERAPEIIDFGKVDRTCVTAPLVRVSSPWPPSLFCYYQYWRLQSQACARSPCYRSALASNLAARQLLHTQRYGSLGWQLILELAGVY